MRGKLSYCLEDLDGLFYRQISNDTCNAREWYDHHVGFGLAGDCRHCEGLEWDYVAAGNSFVGSSVGYRALLKKRSLSTGGKYRKRVVVDYPWYANYFTARYESLSTYHWTLYCY
jgi:hypothetical protein